MALVPGAGKACQIHDTNCTATLCKHSPCGDDAAIREAKVASDERKKKARQARKRSGVAAGVSARFC